jgi:Predicted membrane protein (DUF2232)
MSTDEAAAPREHGWALFLSALAGFILLPATPVLQVLGPVSQPVVMLVTLLAVCTLVGWAAGGRFVVALAWVLLAIAALFSGAPRGGPGLAYVELERGWIVLFAAAFGFVSLAGRSARFFPRALVSIVVALSLASVALLGVSRSVPAVRQAISAEEARRTALIEQRWQAYVNTPVYKSAMASVPDNKAAVEMQETTHDLLTTLPAREGLRFFPALLALESLCALALAWALYHRLSRARIGAPLARLRDFRFNDQLVWGVVVGIVFLAVPTLHAWRGVGANLTLFFGTLYAVRGTGVLAWFLRSARPGLVTLLAVALLAGMLAPAFALGLGLIGLGDTWEDWRAKARPTT